MIVLPELIPEAAEEFCPFPIESLNSYQSNAGMVAGVCVSVCVRVCVCVDATALCHAEGLRCPHMEPRDAGNVSVEEVDQL